jgi:two-component system phosphate regulon response regulator OmpR
LPPAREKATFLKQREIFLLLPHETFRMTEQNSILVLDDDPDVRELLTDYFSGQGYRVTAVATGEAMREALGEQPPDVVLLDVGLPGEDGLSLARYVREHFNVGIIMVSGAGETVDRIVGLEVGADDYVAKPFDPRELHARVKSVLRRYSRQPGAATGVKSEGGSEPNRVPFGIGILDLDSCQLLGLDGAEIPLTAMEFGLLKVFAERPNRPLSRDQLLNLTQHRDWDPYDRSVDIRIARLRRKIEPDPRNPTVLRTVRGMGYMFVPPKSKSSG